MKVLHLCPNYPNNKLFKELITSLHEININQLIYIPVKKKEDYNKNIVNKLRSANYIYSNIYSDFDRIFYYRKVNKILYDIKKNVNLDNIDLVHTHTLFSMGGIALKLKRGKNIDYIVTVRSTDVNLFFKYMLHIRKIGINIMKEAKKIIFISPVYKEFVVNHYVPYELRDCIKQKSVIIPNGVNSFWLENKYVKSEYKTKKKFGLIYVGDFSKNKNIATSIKVAKKLKDLKYNVNFVIVGSGRGYKCEYKIEKLAKENDDIIKIYDYIEDKEKLLNIYRESDIFIMPSFHETFGLVYVEAMSQGLPIIYTKGQGIDGYFEDGIVGYSVDPKDVSDIVKKIEMIINDYNRISKNCYNLVDKFSWERIAKMYHNIYNSEFN